MRITTINIPKEHLKDGLEEIKLDRLSDIILIAGKNGSGKTRLLNNIKHYLSNKLTIAEISQNKIRIKQQKENIRYLNKEINLRSTSLDEQVIQEVLDYKNNLTNSENYLGTLETAIRNSMFIITTNEKTKALHIDFVPKELRLEDSNDLTKSKIISYANDAKKDGTINIHKGTLPTIELVQNTKFNATHQDSETSEIERKKAIDDYERLSTLILKILKTKLSRDSDGNPLLYGIPIGKAKLSDGQKVLLQLCVALYAQEATLEDVIIFMDEPENHLHPSALIEVIERLKECVTNGQIWIATHSVPLLAHFGPSNIYYMEDNKISYAGDVPGIVLEGLLGDEDEIAKLQDFTNLPGVLALNKYAFECLFEPGAIMTGSSDPQTLQIKSNLQYLMIENKLKILDYGAGKGRLLSNIFESLKGETEEFIKSFDYVAFDKYEEDKNSCIKQIESVYGNADNRYFNDMNTLLSHHDKESFNVVIMCNVLHEIDPKEWLNLFRKDSGKGVIINLLAENGILLHVEDTLIPIGEKAFQNGFIVLDTPQIKDLFCIKQETDKNFHVDMKKEERLKAHLIPRECLERITADTKKAALLSISNTAKEKIKELRNNKNRNYKNGKKHAYWVQQLANTQLALSEMI